MTLSAPSWPSRAHAHQRNIQSMRVRWLQMSIARSGASAASGTRSPVSTMRTPIARSSSSAESASHWPTTSEFQRRYAARAPSSGTGNSASDGAISTSAPTSDVNHITLSRATPFAEGVRGTCTSARGAGSSIRNRDGKPQRETSTRS